ncbi:MAG: hypothetical protein DRI36_06345 [Caldiserica bacterium]|nr:MAG: hypothetical protein DRI36_06345 [Caldisericota bacterium]
MIFLLFALLFSATIKDKAYLLEINGVIDPVVSDYIKAEFKEIPDDTLIVIKLNTPGGLMDAMQEIVSEILNKQAIIVVWVSPEGAKAASAGTFITLAGDFACMSDNTTIGSAHPVSMGMVKMDEVMKKKIVEDALSTIRGLAKRRNRNIKIAEETVKDAKSLNSEEALKVGLIDFKANSMKEILEKLNGEKIKKKEKEYVLETKEIKIIEKRMPLIKRFLHSLSHPNIAYILLLLGIYGLIYEASTPGVGFGLAIGTVSLILAFFSLKVLPINLAGVLLIIIGIILMFLDLTVGTLGILTVAGIVSIILGGMMLVREGFLRVSPLLLISTAIVLGIFTILIFGAIIKSQRKKPETGKEGLIGMKGKVIEKIEEGKEGLIFIRGEYWKAISFKEIEEGKEVIVKEVKGNLLVVE